MPKRDELSDLLRQLRKSAGLTIDQAADQLGIAKGTLSRYENGRTVPEAGRAYFIAEGYGAPAAERRRARELASLVRSSTRRVVLARHRAVEKQAEIAQTEKASRLIRTFSPLIVPGLLQTEAYMRVVFGSGLPPEKTAKAVRERRKRQALLGDPDHEFVQVMTYGVLTWCAGDAGTMADQLEHIVDTSRLPGVRVGVIPPRTPARTFPLHAIDVYDERAAAFGTVTATAVVGDDSDVALAIRAFEAAAELAVWEGEAREVLIDEAQRYRNNNGR